MLARLLLRDWSAAREMQRALETQKRLDLFDLQCQDCGGLGVVIDLDRALRVPCDCPGCHGPGCSCIKCVQALVMGWTCTARSFAGKRCPACDGLGSPRSSH
jgi:hypothetical protein